MSAPDLIVEPWLPLTEQTDKQLMSGLLLSIAPEPRKKAVEWRLYKEIERRVSYVLKERTRGLPDPETAYAEALIELTTEANARYFIDEYRNTLPTFAGTITKHRTVAKAGLLDQTARHLRPASLDQMSEDAPDKVPAEAAADVTWEQLEAGHVVALRERFENLAQSVLDPQEIRAIEEYADLWTPGRTGFASRETVGQRMRVARFTASRYITSAQQKIEAHDRFMGSAIRALIERSAEEYERFTGDRGPVEAVARGLRTYAKAA